MDCQRINVAQLANISNLLIPLGRKNQATALLAIARPIPIDISIPQMGKSPHLALIVQRCPSAKLASEHHPLVL